MRQRRNAQRRRERVQVVRLLQRADERIARLGDVLREHRRMEEELLGRPHERESGEGTGSGLPLARSSRC